MRILYFDIDGGRGGSGRSLYYLIKYLDRNKYTPHVIMGREGPNQFRYDALGITHEVQYLPRAISWHRRNWYTYPRMGMQIGALRRLLSKVRRIKNENGIDCIHFNHESLFYIGWWLKRIIGSQTIFHIRTQMVPGVWARLQTKIIDSIADHLIFITENERAHFTRLNGGKLQSPHSVIHNSADSEDGAQPSGGMARSSVSPEAFDRRFKILSLSNLSYIKGVDRLVEVAEAMLRLGETHSVFVICGREADPGMLNKMRGRIRAGGLENYFFFAGWHPDPERFIEMCESVINLSRDYNPWGRDIIEAMTRGRPVLSIGSYSKFVEHGKTGILLMEYHPESVAKELIRLRNDSEYREQLGRNARARAKKLFDGRTQARRVEEIYEVLVGPAERPV